MSAAPLTRVMLLTREGKLPEALEVIRNSASLPFPWAYALVHARLRPPQPDAERWLDDGLRYHCPGT